MDEKSALREIVGLMNLVVLEEVEELRRLGEFFPVGVWADGATRRSRRLKRLLPEPAGEDPHNPGVFGGFPRGVARRCLQQVYGRGYLLDDTGGADPDGSHWQVYVLGPTLEVKLVTTRGGEEVVLRRHAVEF